MTMGTVWVVVGEWSEGEDKDTTITVEGVFTSECDANEYANTLQRNYHGATFKMHKTAIDA
jgi:hypothetical protein